MPDATKAEAEFRKDDVNSGGVVTKKELKHYFLKNLEVGAKGKSKTDTGTGGKGAAKSKGKGTVADMAKEVLLQLDVNGNGTLEREELVDVHPEATEDFSEADQDANGSLTQLEVEEIIRKKMAEEDKQLAVPATSPMSQTLAAIDTVDPSFVDESQTEEHDV